MSLPSPAQRAAAAVPPSRRRWMTHPAALLSSAALLTAVIAGQVGTVAAGAATSRVKPVIHGLIDRQGAPSPAVLSSVHAYVVKVNWADLQPTQNGPIVADNAIDRAIARVRQPDFAGVGMALKLRVFAGIGAPAWAKSLGGAPIPYVDNQSGASTAGGTIGRFWSPAFVAAYADLQAKLAAKYDNVQEIRETTVSGCTTIFDEPFVRQVGLAQNRDNLLSAGYTVAADEACITDAITAQDVWQHTTSDMDFAPFPLVTAPNDPRDLSFTLSEMATCRAVLGSRCGLQNNALSSDKLANPTFVAMYNAMTSLGGTVVFQTAAAKRMGDPTAVLQAASRMRAMSVELPAGYAGWPVTVLQSGQSSLQATAANRTATRNGSHR